MEAGRDLDALIAEKVFGQRVVWKHDQPWPEGAPVLVDEADNLDKGPYTLANGFYKTESGEEVLSDPVSVPCAFSTAIRDAMLITSHFTNRIALYGPNACVWNEYMNGTEWTCEITVERTKLHTTGIVGITVSAPTAPLAICLAALKAIEHVQVKTN